MYITKSKREFLFVSPCTEILTTVYIYPSSFHILDVVFDTHRRDTRYLSGFLLDTQHPGANFTRTVHTHEHSQRALTRRPSALFPPLLRLTRPI